MNFKKGILGMLKGIFGSLNVLRYSV